MADLFTVVSDKGVMDQSLILKYQEGVLLAAKEMTNFYKGSPLISQEISSDGTSVAFIKFAALDGAGALTDGEDATSDAVVDSRVTVTLAEYGNVVTYTDLGNVVTDGRLMSYVPEMVGRDMGTYIDKHFILLLEAGSNEYTVNASGEASTAANVITPTFLEKAYTFLRGNNVPKLVDDSYVAVMHPHVLSDLRNGTGAGSFEDVYKYLGKEQILKNEVGKLRGFKIIESSNVTINTDAGNSTVDTYHSSFFGGNALGCGWSKSRSPKMTMVTGTDRLDRFTHIGWKGIWQGGLIDTNSSCIVTSASAFGANT